MYSTSPIRGLSFC